MLDKVDCPDMLAIAVASGALSYLESWIRTMFITVLIPEMKLTDPECLALHFWSLKPLPGFAPGLAPTVVGIQGMSQHLGDACVSLLFK